MERLEILVRKRNRSKSDKKNHERKTRWKKKSTNVSYKVKRNWLLFHEAQLDDSLVLFIFFFLDFSFTLVLNIQKEQQQSEEKNKNRNKRETNASHTSRKHKTYFICSQIKHNNVTFRCVYITVFRFSFVFNVCVCFFFHLFIKFCTLYFTRCVMRHVLWPFLFTWNVVYFISIDNFFFFFFFVSYWLLDSFLRITIKHPIDNHRFNWKFPHKTK